MNKSMQNLHCKYCTPINFSIYSTVQQIFTQVLFPHLQKLKQTNKQACLTFQLEAKSLASKVAEVISEFD